MPDLLTNLSVNGYYGSWGSELRVIAAVGAALLIAWGLTRGGGFAGGVLIVLVCLLSAQAVHSYRADTSPLYPVPDTPEFEAAIDDLNATMPADGVALVPKD